jgi:D-psicose/D-tagatose/L-ribulose 3-epimerase
MSIGISNLAFKDYSFGKIIKFIEHSPISGIEIAPTLLWEKPISVSTKERNDINKIAVDHGLSIIGLQSLFYNQLDMQILGSPKSQKDCKEYLKHMIDLCADIGGTILSFGSSHNRKRHKLQFIDAISMSAAFFSEMALYAKSAGVLICIEPVSSHYGCDFINTADEGAQLVYLVNDPNFRLMLDTGSMLLNEESCEDKIVKYSDIIAHMHINDPKLFPPSKKFNNHYHIADKLRNTRYKGWLTMEFIQYYSKVEDDIAFGIKCYSGI